MSLDFILMQWFLHFNVHSKHLGMLLQCAESYLLDLELSLLFCISNILSVAVTSGPWSIFKIASS